MALMLSRWKNEQWHDFKRKSVKGKTQSQRRIVLSLSKDKETKMSERHSKTIQKDSKIRKQLWWRQTVREEHIFRKWHWKDKTEQKM